MVISLDELRGWPPCDEEWDEIKSAIEKRMMDDLMSGREDRPNIAYYPLLWREYTVARKAESGL